MQNINIGKSGIAVPFLGMGTWAIGGGAWWGDNDDALSVKAIQTAVEQGIQWIDTAPIYGLYHSEEVVGEAMKHIDRDKVVLSTKCGLEWRHESPILHKVVDGVQVYRDLSAKSIIEDVEDSLRRLHTDHLDVLYTHWQSPDFGVYPLEETMEAMMKLKEQGKIRAIGASNVTSDIIRGYCKYGQLDVIQEKYSLLTRRIEKQLLPTCKELGVSVQAYSPLEQGLLTGKVTMDTTYPEGSTRNTNPCFQPTRRAQALELLAKWGDLTEKYDCTMAQLVIAMTARMIPGLHVLCGARKPEQVLDNAGAMQAGRRRRRPHEVGRGRDLLRINQTTPEHLRTLRCCFLSLILLLPAPAAFSYPAPARRRDTAAPSPPAQSISASGSPPRGQTPCILPSGSGSCAGPRRRSWQARRSEKWQAADQRS